MIYKLFSKIGDTFFPDPSQQSSNEQQILIHQNEVHYIPSELPHPMSRYMEIANTQYNAMEYAGTDKEALFGSLLGLNAKELHAVYDSYGIRELHTFGFGDGKKTLIQAYYDELSGDSLNTMLKIWKKTNLV